MQAKSMKRLSKSKKELVFLQTVIALVIIARGAFSSLSLIVIEMCHLE